MRYKNKSGKNGDEPPRKKVVLAGEVGADSRDNTLADDNREVSDDGSECSSYSHADAVINDRANVLISKNDKSCTLDAIISEEYDDEEVIPQLPPIDEKLAVVLTKWLRVLPPRDKVKELFRQCMLPINVDGLQPVKINSIVYEKLNASFKVNDQCLRGINTFLTRGLGPIVSIWDNILKWETAMSTEMSAKISGSLGVIQMGNLSLDFTDIRRQLDRSLKLLCSANGIILDRRRQQLRPFFDNKFHYLLKPSNPITSELLGDNVDVKVTEAVKISEAAQRLQFSPRLYPRSRPGRYRSRYTGNKRGGSIVPRGARKHSHRPDNRSQFGNTRFTPCHRFPRSRGGRFNNRSQFYS